MFPGLQHEIEIQGDTSGRIWRFNPSLNRILKSSGERYLATAVDDGSAACLHCCEKGGLWLDEAERLEAALVVVGHPKIVAASSIRQLLDVRVREPDAREFFERAGDLVAIWEWADISLEEFLDEPDENPSSVADGVDANTGQPLRCSTESASSISTCSPATSSASTDNGNSPISIRVSSAGHRRYGGRSLSGTCIPTEGVKRSFLHGKSSTFSDFGRSLRSYGHAKAEGSSAGKTI